MYEATDLFFTGFGDFELDPYGDLRSTWDDPHRSLRQEIATIAQADFDDWALNPNIGAGVERFIGYENNAETASAIEDSLSKALSSFLLKSNDFRLDIFPLDANTLGIMITVQIGMEGSDIAVVSLPVVFNLGLGIFVA
jgi:hypothetical protein